MKYSNDLKTELAAVPEGKKGVRLLWVHTLPYWQDALRDLINFTDRCEIVACDMVMDAMYCDLEEATRTDLWQTDLSGILSTATARTE